MQAHTHSHVRSKQNRCAFHNHDSYVIRETCAELGSVFSISHELCLVVAKKKITPISTAFTTKPYIWCRFGGAKDIRDGHETMVLDRNREKRYNSVCGTPGDRT